MQAGHSPCRRFVPHRVTSFAATISLELATAGSRDNDELRPSAIKTKQWPKAAAHCHLCDNSNPGYRCAGVRGGPCPCAVNGSCPGLSSRSDNLGSVPPIQSLARTEER